MFKKLKPNLFKEKKKDELDKHYDSLELEKGDFTALVIAAFITFMPIALLIAGAFFLVAKLFGL